MMELDFVAGMFKCMYTWERNIESADLSPSTDTGLLIRLRTRLQDFLLASFNKDIVAYEKHGCDDEDQCGGYREVNWVTTSERSSHRGRRIDCYTVGTDIVCKWYSGIQIITPGCKVVIQFVQITSSWFNGIKFWIMPIAITQKDDVWTVYFLCERLIACILDHCDYPI